MGQTVTDFDRITINMKFTLLFLALFSFAALLSVTDANAIGEGTEGELPQTRTIFEPCLDDEDCPKCKYCKPGFLWFPPYCVTKSGC